MAASGARPSRTPSRTMPPVRTAASGVLVAGTARSATAMMQPIVLVVEAQYSQSGSWARARPRAGPRRRQPTARGGRGRASSSDCDQCRSAPARARAGAAADGAAGSDSGRWAVGTMTPARMTRRCRSQSRACRPGGSPRAGRLGLHACSCDPCSSAGRGGCARARTGQPPGPRSAPGVGSLAIADAPCDQTCSCPWRTTDRPACSAHQREGVRLRPG